MQVVTKRILVNRTLKKAKKIICISEFTKNEIKKYFPNVDEKKIEVIHNGFAYNKINLKGQQVRLDDKVRITKKYLLYVGTIAPHKNIERLIQAFYNIKKQGYDYQLVIAGKRGWMYEGVFQTVKKLNLENEVIFTGYISDDVLELLYKKSEIFCFVSMYEGFGFPPLEAMAREIPVLTSNVASIPEVVGDAAYIVNPYNVDDIAKGMVELLTEGKLRSNLIQKGLERVKKFTWDECAKQTFEVYRKVIEEN
jgi:glycosyltransferase involved in cell wall biosynthesis